MVPPIQARNNSDLHLPCAGEGFAAWLAVSAMQETGLSAMRMAIFTAARGQYLGRWQL